MFLVKVIGKFRVHITGMCTNALYKKNAKRDIVNIEDNTVFASQLAQLRQEIVNSNSNSTFIVLNLYLLTDSKKHKAKNQRS